MREAAYQRLRRHFGFVNEMQLFAEVHHVTKYSINIYGPVRTAPLFDQLANLFTPATVDACYQHDGSGIVGGYKNVDDQWNTAGHRDRIVRIDESALSAFAKLYDEPGTPARRARLPALHAGALSGALEKLAAFPTRLADLEEEFITCEMWHETMQQRDGTISRRPSTDSQFPSTATEWIISGPHFFLANPFNKTPRKICSSNGNYDLLDLQSLPDDYLPRTNYQPMVDRNEYERRIPRVSWVEPGATIARPVTEYFRLAFRGMISSSSERTLAGALIPSGAAHIHTLQTSAFRTSTTLVHAASISSSLVSDFFIKSTGKAWLGGNWLSLPSPSKYFPNQV